MDIKITITDKEITPCGDNLPMEKMLDRMDFDTCLDGLVLPQSWVKQDHGDKKTTLAPVVLSCGFYAVESALDIVMMA